ncbi:type IV pilus assembly protein PilX [Pseudoduganella lurida]|uniref:Type IV pilus assembly protein PilX n=1 Tax=Pseudoduganella lurida TaxID=1036180 RepID=A0A562RMD5_9BURK|nr:pilus assembly protein [Pseudoduganella lurida]TWI70207.1 type IV pilus assembly protein PilX [Pseudoduganella lurida]
MARLAGTRGREAGITLIVSLLMLVAVMLLAAAAAGTALMGEKAARAERDRHVALQAAEDALMDAEHDLDTAAAERADLLAAPAFAPGCGTGSALGLCARSAPGDPPPWQTVDLAGASAVPFGHFTGAAMETGSGFAPLRRPQYIVERLPYHRPGEEAGGPPRYFYRVTAIGFGSRAATQVVLQTAYRRPED